MNRKRLVGAVLAAMLVGGWLSAAAPAAASDPGALIRAAHFPNAVYGGVGNYQRAPAGLDADARVTVASVTVASGSVTSLLLDAPAGHRTVSGPSLGGVAGSSLPLLAGCAILLGAVLLGLASLVRRRGW